MHSLQLSGTEFDFGTVKVVDGKTQTIELINSGKYDVQYRFVVSRRSPLKDMVTFEPAEGVIPASASSADAGGKAGKKAAPPPKAGGKAGASAGGSSGQGTSVLLTFRTDREFQIANSQDIRLYLSDSVRRPCFHVPSLIYVYTGNIFLS